MISKKVIDKKVPDVELHNYLTCNANKDFYVENEGHENIIKKTINGITYPKIFSQFHKDPKARLLFDSFQSGSLITKVDGKDFVVTILRILNFDNVPVAYISAIEKDEFRNTLFLSYILSGSIRFSIILLFLTLLIVTFLKNRELNIAKEKIKVLDGLLPICSHCKKIRDDNGEWEQLENFIDKKSEAKFSHSVCPDCAKKHYSSYLNTRND
ncbi:MAG: hypothetical protein PF574_02320 [Candidatus Delongbacteria bacterium]|jgi:hypothetical protein|nr:hypothetical protein [Candidatus Delongbacteria bacterium]